MTIDLLTQKDLVELKEEIISEIRRLLHISEKEQIWLKSSEVKKILGCSDGTLINLRTTGVLPCSKVKGTLYYKKSDLDKLLNSSITA